MYNRGKGSISVCVGLALDWRGRFRMAGPIMLETPAAASRGSFSQASLKTSDQAKSERKHLSRKKASQERFTCAVCGVHNDSVFVTECAQLVLAVITFNSSLEARSSQQLLAFPELEGIEVCACQTHPGVV